VSNFAGDVSLASREYESEKSHNISQDRKNKIEPSLLVQEGGGGGVAGELSPGLSRSSRAQNFWTKTKAWKGLASAAAWD
jgi:hypothetical protein